MRKVPRPFKMPWGKGMVVEEASISSRYHEPTVQLLEIDNGQKGIRFSRSPLMIDERDIGRLGTALRKKKEIRKLLSKL